MPSVTVKVVAGDQKENLAAITIGSKRWGVNGTAKFGQAQDVPAGDDVEVTAYYGKDPSSAGTVDIPANSVTFEVTAGGPGETVLT